MRNSRGFFKDSAYGWDGLSTFVFSNILLLLSGGLGLCWLLSKVLLTAREAPVTINRQLDFKSVWLVAGLCLQNNLPVAEFKTRLERVSELFRAGIETEKILILGGVTGDNQISEAQAGAEYLQQQGIPASLLIREDHSRHTLENLQHARSLLNTHHINRHHAIIISSRYHLYRILTLASGLGMQLMPVGAESRLDLNFRSVRLMLKEAYFLHWYWSGKLWVFFSGNRLSRAKISS